MPRLLEVVHVIHSGAIGGGPQVVLDLVRHVPARHTVITAADGPLIQDARQAGAGTVALRKTGEYSFALSEPVLVRSMWGADVVHLHGQFAGFYGAAAVALARAPGLYTAHFPSFITDSSWRTCVRNRIAEWLPCRVSRLIVACSERNREEYIKRGLVGQEKIVTIYNGVAPGRTTVSTQLLRSQLKLDGPTVLAVGRLTEQKGFDRLLQAIPMVLRAVPNAQFVLAGDGEMRAALEQQAWALGVSGAMRFLGFRRDTADLYGLSSVVVVPSRYDVFPLVPLEAMMLGKPVVASDLPVLREAIEDGETGVLVGPGAADLAVGIVRILRNPGAARVMGERAAGRARDRFGVARMAGEYAEVYERIAGGRQ